MKKEKTGVPTMKNPPPPPPKMRIHILKTIQPFFDDVWYGRKDFELRKNDRDFQIGDRLKLVEYGVSTLPRYILKDIKYILKGGDFGLSKEYVILGLRNVRIR